MSDSIYREYPSRAAMSLPSARSSMPSRLTPPDPDDPGAVLDLTGLPRKTADIPDAVLVRGGVSLVPGTEASGF
jgi:hypothetical protein